MNFHFIGTGAALDFELCNSSAYIEMNGHGILIDCGSNVYGHVKEKNMLDSIEYVMITHLHADHAGSLFLLIIDKFYATPTAVKLKIIFPTDGFRDLLFDYLTFSLVDPLQYVEFISITEMQGIGYLDTTGKHMLGLPSMAYFFENESEVIFFSGDLGDVSVTQQFFEKYNGKKAVTLYHELSFNQEPEHTYYKDLEFFLHKCVIIGYHIDHRKVPVDNKIPLAALHASLVK